MRQQQRGLGGNVLKHNTTAQDSPARQVSCISTDPFVLSRRLFGKTQMHIHSVSQKNDTDVAHYNFNADQPILIIFGRDVAEGQNAENKNYLSAWANWRLDISPALISSLQF